MNTSLESVRSEDLDDIYSLCNSIYADSLRASYYEFFKEAWNIIETKELIDNFHIKYVCDRLQNMYNIWSEGGAPKDLVVNVPPGSSKSRMCTVMFPVWLWIKNPSIKILSNSYSSTLSVDHAVKSRDILRSERFKELFPGEAVIKRDQDNKNDYENESGGRRMATSTTGTATGRHADFIINDDPIDPQLAQSETERLNANNHCERTLSNRKTDKKRTPTILVMQRLHEEDPTGRKIDQNLSFEHICLPAEITDLNNVSPKELEEFYTDGLLDPNRMDREVLESQQVILGGMEYGGQFLQSPKDAGGNIFKREWFDFYEELPMGRPISIINSWDTAFKDKQQNDPSVCTTWAEYETGYYLIGLFEGRLQYPELKAEIKNQFIIHGADRILIEDKASGQSAIQELSRLNLPIMAIPGEKDKILKANQATPPFESGNVYFPYESFVKKIIEQLTGFPNTKHDDIVDSISQYIRYKRNKFTKLVAFSSGQRKTKQILRGYNG